ncbi:unnamed protein product [Rodentolepis nana]|uniref:C2 domain-containing protein n=1 Tax=Rodentolepis nana TaxID=102285 RepID=A0A3P7S885_RODNA|nr:unnamed protein product [Rodentolepis nana]
MEASRRKRGTNRYKDGRPFPRKVPSAVSNCQSAGHEETIEAQRTALAEMRQRLHYLSSNTSNGISPDELISLEEAHRREVLGLRRQIKELRIQLECSRKGSSRWNKECSNSTGNGIEGDIASDLFSDNNLFKILKVRLNLEENYFLLIHTFCQFFSPSSALLIRRSCIDPANSELRERIWTEQQKFAVSVKGKLNMLFNQLKRNASTIQSYEAQMAKLRSLIVEIKQLRAEKMIAEAKATDIASTSTEKAKEEETEAAFEINEELQSQLNVAKRQIDELTDTVKKLKSQLADKEKALIFLARLISTRFNNYILSVTSSMKGYICPSDRQLALRASTLPSELYMNICRLGTGWSTVALANQRRVNTRLSNEELDHIYRVLQRNDSINEKENRRVKSMLQRLENMKMSTVPQTKTTCSLCGHEFGLLLKSSAHCADCGRLVCLRCSMEFVEVSEKSKQIQDPADISPSRYLPPGSTTAASAAEKRNFSRTVPKFWGSQQMSEQRDNINDESGSLDQSAFNGSTRGRSKHKSFSLERRQSLSRISNLFTIPRSLTPSTTITPTSNRYHLCKLCCEAREVWKRSGAWFHKGFPKSGLHSSCPASPLTGRSVTTADGWTSLLARGPTETLPTGAAALAGDEDWTRIEKRPTETGPSTEGVAGGFTATRYTPEGVVTRKISREESGSPPDTIVANSRNEGSSSTGSPLGIFDNSPWKQPPDQKQSSKPNSSPTSKLNPREPSPIHESLSQNSLQALELPPQRGRESKIPSLFPETKMALGLGSPNIIPPTFAPPPDLKFKRESSPFTKPATSFAEAPLGILYFSVIHDVPNCELHVRIHNAKNLIAMDANGLSDPFVVCQLLPAAGKRFRTRTIPQNLNPIWNETYTFTDFDNRKLDKRVLRFAVLDEDIYGADWLGEYRLSLGELLPDRLSEFAVPLNPRKPLPKEIDDLANPTRGKIQIALRYIDESKQLSVEVLRCAELAPMDHNGYSDPFVKLYLRPDKQRKTKQKTKVKKSTLFPEFNEQFYFNMDALEVNKRTLEITVWDFDRGVTNDFIGGLTLGAKAKAERREVWQAVFRPPYRRFEAWFQLASRSDIDCPGNESQDGSENLSNHTPTPGICD